MIAKGYSSPSLTTREKAKITPWSSTSATRLGRGLEFDDYPEDMPNFAMYAGELRCLTPVVDIKTTPLPPREDLAEIVTILLHVGLRSAKKEPRTELENIQRAEGVTKEWFPETHGPCSRDLRINAHLGAGGVMTPGRTQDPEEAKTVVTSFKTTAGAVVAIHKQPYKIVRFSDAVGGRLRVGTAATT